MTEVDCGECDEGLVSCPGCLGVGEYWHDEAYHRCYRCENGKTRCHTCCDERITALEAKLARRDAAFAALVDANAELVGAMSRLLEYARFGHHVEDKEKFEAAHDKGREALKLAEGVEE